MAYLVSDSYDYGTFPFDTVDTSGGGQSISALAAHTGAYGLIIQGVGRWSRYAMPGTPDNASVGLWIDPYENYGNDDGFSIELELTTGEFIEIRWDGVNKTFDAWVDGVKVADGTIPVTVNDWFHVQFYAFIDNAGFIRTKIDGVADIFYVGDTLPVGAAASIAYVYLATNTSGIVHMDDLIIGTDDFTGDVRVEWLPPDADTAVDDWSKSVGVDAYAVVDEVPANDADYLFTSNNGDEEELELTDWIGLVKTPVLVTSRARAREDVATGEQLEVGADSGGVEDTTLHTVTDSWRYYDHVMQQDPFGPAAWTNAAIDALLHRLEAVI